MKKNKMMRLASSLLVAVLLTSSVISGTFAKYVTSDEATDSARVATWGVVVDVTGNLFGKAYAKATDNTIAAASTNVSATENVVAPGTKNEEGFQVTFTGTPEVEYAVSATTEGTIQDIYLVKGNYGVMVEVATGLLNAATDVTEYYVKSSSDAYVPATGTWNDSTTYYELHDPAVVSEEKYYPITWIVDLNGAETTYKGLNYVVNDILVAELNTISGKANEPIDSNYNLSWIWAYEGQNDGADTILGNLQAGLNVVKLSGTTDYVPVVSSDYSLNVSVGLEVTVTQVD